MIERLETETSFPVIPDQYLMEKSGKQLLLTAVGTVLSTDESSRELLCRLTSSQTAVLRAVAGRPNELVTYEDISRAMGGEIFVPEDAANIRQCLKNAKKRLGQAGVVLDGKLFLVRGQGYIWKDESIDQNTQT
jgi:hypothetical protein